MTAYEYCRLRTAGYEPSLDQLNMLGGEGWQFVFMIPDYIYFTRPIPVVPPPPKPKTKRQAKELTKES